VLTFAITSTPVDGSVTNNNNGSFTFNAGSSFQDLAEGETRDVTFTYSATDDSGADNATSVNGAVTITVTGTNAQPLVVDVDVNAEEDSSAVSGNFVGTDIDTTDELIFTIIGSPADGTVINNNNGTFTYDPGSSFQDLAQGATRDVTFNYTATDNSGAGNATSLTGTVKITVIGTNDQPTVSNINASAVEDGSAITSSFSGTDFDSADILSFSIVSQPAEGTVTNNNNGTFTFNPDPSFC
jgi:VCBS repeat-containing protein